MYFDREACAIESTARWNPNRSIFILFPSPVGVYKNGTKPQLIEILTKYPNIHFRTMNLWRFSYQTPLFEWLKTDEIFKSEYLIEHISDIFRMVTLLKYGGLYLDLDVILLKNMDYLGEDFIGDDWDSVANNAVIHARVNGTGRKLTEKFLR